MDYNIKRYRRLGLLALLFCIFTIFFGGFIVISDTNDEAQPNSGPEEVKNPVVLQDGVNNSISATNAAFKGIVTVHVIENNTVRSKGTGFLYTDDHIVTNEHVIGSSGDYYVETGASRDYYVEFSKGEWKKADLVGSDRYTDLGVLRVDEKPDYAESLRIQKQPPKIGERVIAIGSAQNYDNTVTSGIVSGTERSMTTYGKYAIPDMIQTDAALNPGNSGGPLYSVDRNSVIGVNRATDGENIGFAISSRLMGRVVKSIIESGDHDHPRVGILTVEMNPAIEGYESTKPNEGIIVTDVFSDTAASGKFETDINGSSTVDAREGDIIVSVDGNNITDNEDLSSYLLLEKSPGEKATFRIYRDGEIETVELELGKR